MRTGRKLVDETIIVTENVRLNIQLRWNMFEVSENIWLEKIGETFSVSTIEFPSSPF